MRREKHDAEKAQERQERDAEAAAQQKEGAELRARCQVIYDGTSDKRIGDLTVKEEQQVRACQALRIYPPS